MFLLLVSGLESVSLEYLGVEPGLGEQRRIHILLQGVRDSAFNRAHISFVFPAQEFCLQFLCIGAGLPDLYSVQHNDWFW